MAKSRGVVYVAFGQPARFEVQESIQTLRKHCNYPIAVISDSPLGEVQTIEAQRRDRGARWQKLNLDSLSPFDQTLYLDADTRIHQSIEAGFHILDDGWDIVIVPSANQIDTDGWLWHCDAKDRTEVAQVYGTFPLVLQGGAFWFQKNECTTQFFATWRSEWKKYSNQDQGALLRALYYSPVKVWLLGRPWNGRKGQVVQHLFGRARER